MLNAIKVLWKRLRPWLVSDPPPTSGYEKIAYDAGYAAYDSGEKNPHLKGTHYYKAWKRGLDDRTSEEMSYW